jgi:hypothetical protein
MSAAAAAATILELDPSHERAGRVIEEIVRLEKRIFPKHESLARSFHDELKRRNSGLIYSTSSAKGDEVAGYAMYTCNTSLCATITKLAGENTYGARSVNSLIQFSAEDRDPRQQLWFGGRSEGELQASGTRRDAAGGRRGAEGPAGVPPRRPGKDGRRCAVPEGRFPSRCHRPGLLRATEERLPNVH